MFSWLSSKEGEDVPAVSNGSRGGTQPEIQELAVSMLPRVAKAILPQLKGGETRGRLAQLIKGVIADIAIEDRVELNLLDQRNLVTALLNRFIDSIGGVDALARGDSAAAAREPEDWADPGLEPDETPVRQISPEAAAQANALVLYEESDGDDEKARPKTKIEVAKEHLQPLLLERIDAGLAAKMDRVDLQRDVSSIVGELMQEEQIHLNQREKRELVDDMINDMLGLGPLEELLADDRVTDIMVNGPKQVYVERGGKLDLTKVEFRDNAHVMSIASRIVSRIGRRIDESVPLVDARLLDGSRVNIIIPPLAIDGPSISIRKFAKKKITLDVMERQANLSAQMATVLRIASRSRLNILISGGTGSGKTTLLNALSRLIDSRERIVTIEDAAELQLQQPHVVRLETRAPNLEGTGEITMRHLLKNTLRMRPDRIILGEIRGEEAIDMLQAMNTGHDGSLSTIHANRPREALTRLENMVGMSGINLPPRAVRTQIAAAVHMIVQISRMRDGIRRITHISEIVGMEEDIISMQDLFWFEYKGEDRNGRLVGDFVSGGVRPHFTSRAAYYGLEQLLVENV
ncbi:CpaF family protein [Oceanibacterium hippocampi]|uniref:Putative conjugal transfer protein/MT3759 n=1 Tax=Oceanibacterium hippocampi TaxID=745714 RepID=A0A1Y5SB19_9PROT|nr:CpaF family protein [Oceanibacterium hippocampi]SLN36665.1 Putative conjugal transfer protein/MT3759 [Oceanibacterium hippocampi]